MGCSSSLARIRTSPPSAPESNPMSAHWPHRPRPTVFTVAVGAVAVVLLGTLIAALVFFAHGGRWFVVTTPSMGTVAPVGTLVLTTPTAVSALQNGDIISFHPPSAPAETYTHRVYKISPEGGVTSKGDINGAVDSWTLHSADLIGRATTVLPGVGWLARGLPILVIGFLLVFLLTRLLRSRPRRASMRIVGVSLVVAVAAYVLRPFTGLVVLQTFVRGGHAGATVVSTGLLPIQVTAEHGNRIELLTGQVGQLSMPRYLEDGYYRISSALHLDVGGWIVFVLVCCIPLLGTLIFGLPAEEPLDGGAPA